MMTHFWRGLVVFVASAMMAPIVVAEPGASLDLPVGAIVSPGPNTYKGDVLEIVKGRGATIAWYIEAKVEDRVRVVAEYSCEAPLNQDYQLSFDGENQFWKVVPTALESSSRIELGTFDMRKGLPILVQLVPPAGTKYPHPVKLKRLILEGSVAGNLRLIDHATENLPPPAPVGSPGFGAKLTKTHPALDFRDLRDESLTLTISGLALKGENELLLTTWEGDLFSLDLSASVDREAPRFQKIAQGLSEPMGLVIDGDRIFVTEKNQATELLDRDGDGAYETYRCLSQDWPATMDYHEYLFGAVVRDGGLYFCSSVGMARRGIDNYQAPLRGSVIRVDLESGETEILAGGLRTPDGVGKGPGESLLILDNQGEWLPANKLIVFQKESFYGFRSIPPRHPMDLGEEMPPAIWLPQGEIAASPTQPVTLPASWGPYQGHILFGDATYGGLQRAFVEEVEGISQGAVFRFSQGFRHLFHRLALTPEGELYAGGIARGKDQEFIHRVSGLTHLRFTGEMVFEPLAARIKSNGLELEFTEPLATGTGWSPGAYYVTRWGYQPTQTYGGQKIRHRRAEVLSASVSPDRRRVFLEIPDLVENEVVKVRLPHSFVSEAGHPLWSGDLWYTINRLPAQSEGDVLDPPETNQTTAIPFFTFEKGNLGETVYRTYCAACHSSDATPLAGPTFAGIGASKRQVRSAPGAAPKTIEATRDYLRQSILDPNALLVDGYDPNLMPPLAGLLSTEEVEAVIDYILTLKKTL